MRFHRDGVTPPHLDDNVVIAAPLARSARFSVETSALMVCPFGLVAIQAPFSDDTTPGGTASVTTSGRMTSPRSLWTRTLLPFSSLRALASCGFISSGGVSLALPPSPNRVEEIRASDAGEMSIKGNLSSRGRKAGRRTPAPQRSARRSEASSTLPEGVAGLWVT
ncbi:MAG: hypothetical protein R3D67_15885 [Hyphomicrobiaceae bacterium]